MTLKKRLCISLAFLLALTGSVVAQETKYLRIGTSSVGGGFYLIGNTIAQLGQHSMKDRVITAVTGNSNKSCISMEKGELEFGIIGSPNLTAAWSGAAPFRQPLKKLRYVTTIYPMPSHILVAKSAGIKSIADFKGKRVDFGPVGSNVEASTREVLAIYGLTDKDTKVERFGRAEFDEAFKSQQIEGHIWSSTLPNAQIADLLRSGEIGLLTPEPAKVKEILARYPHFMPYAIPGKTYGEYPDDIATFAVVGALVTHEDMPEDVVYQLTKMLHENKAFLKDRLGSYFAEFDLKLALLGRGEVPLHPGAAKYYREKGLL